MKTSTIPMLAINSTEYDAIKSGLMTTLDGKKVYLCLETPVMPFSCQKCGRAAKTKRANAVHERFSHGIKGKFAKKGKK